MNNVKNINKVNSVPIYIYNQLGLCNIILKTKRQL